MVQVTILSVSFRIAFQFYFHRISCFLLIVCDSVPLSILTENADSESKRLYREGGCNEEQKRNCFADFKTLAEKGHDEVTVNLL